MPIETLEETFVEQRVMYTLEVDGRFVIVEQVPVQRLATNRRTVLLSGNGRKTAADCLGANGSEACDADAGL